MATRSISVLEAPSRFFRWWGGELFACLPAGVRESMERGRERLIIEVSDTRAAFSHAKGRSFHRLGDLPVSEADLEGQRDGGHGDAAARLVRKAGLRSSEVVLRLPREKVLRRLVELPAAASENLREVLGFEMDRHTPFKADEVYYDFRIEAGDPKRKRIKVDLVVVPKALADRAIRLAKSWGLEPDQLEVPGGADGAGRPFNLLPRSAVRGAGGLRRRLTLLLAVAACALLVAAGYVPLRQKQEVLASTQADLARVRAEAVHADEIKTRLEDMMDGRGFLIERKRRERTVTELLDEVTRLLPDNTWALKFAVRDQRLILSGYSAKPSALIALLEESKMLSEVRFSSPVTMDQKVGMERFNLTAVVTPREAP